MEESNSFPVLIFAVIMVIAVAVAFSFHRASSDMPTIAALVCSFVLAISPLPRSSRSVCAASGERLRPQTKQTGYPKFPPA
jgi:hypothetical protein